MKAKDIELKVDGKPPLLYAVKLPVYLRHGAPARETAIFEAVIEDIKDGKVYGYVLARPGGAWALGGCDFETSLANVLSTWHDHEVAVAHEAAHAEERRRQQEADYQAKRAAIKDDVEGWVHLFAGIPCEGYSTGEPVDMEYAVRDYFVRQGSSTITLKLADVRGIAERMAAFQRLALDAGQGWVGGMAQDTGIPEVAVLPPRKDDALDRLADVIARTSGE